jgi:hypothetical protein
MAGSIWEQFAGGFYKALVPVMGSDQAVNIYTETRQVPGSPKQIFMFGTPGLKLFATVATQGNRGWFSQDGRTFTVVGATLYEVDADAATATSRGTIVDDGLPVFYASNGAGGDQLGIVGGGQLKVLDLVTNVLSAAISLPFSNPVTITFLDGYGLINEQDTPIVWFSALEDLETWDALDFFTRSNTSDNIIGIAATKDRIACLGSKTTTWYYDSGDADTPFLPYPGTTVQTGLTQPALLGVYNDELFFVAKSERGQIRVARMMDTQVQTISTPPIDAFLANAPTLADAELLIYYQEGHAFIAITAPSSPDHLQTPCYDLTEWLWHFRAGWDTETGQYLRWRARGSAVEGTRVFVGDYANGNLYTLDLETYADELADDETSILKAERTAPYASAIPQWLFINAIQLLAQAGVGLGGSGSGSDPMVQLEISRDGAQTWIDCGLRALGKIGQYTQRTIWRQLGRVRADLFVLRVTQTAPVRRAWGPLWIDLENGTNQL